MGCGCRKRKANFKKEVQERRSMIIAKREQDELEKELESLTPREKRFRIRQERAKRRKERIEARNRRIAIRQAIEEQNKKDKSSDD